MESRIQDCPGFPYMGRFVFSYMTGAMQTSKLKPKQQKQRFAFHRPAVAQTLSLRAGVLHPIYVL